MVPATVTVVPLYLMMAEVGLRNTFWALVLPFMFGSPYAIFLLRQHFRAIPTDLIRAAWIDGASTLDVLVHVVLPASRPILVTLALITVVSQWNSFMWPLVITSGSKWQVLTVATLLVALLPWNLPLMWMLRRLRFAMEVDCDARVVHKGADPNDYGLALLYVSERQSRSPFTALTAIPLIERTSQLEKRINFMFNTHRKHRVLIAGICLAMAGSCLFAATKLDAPRLGASELVLKPPPAMDAESPGMKLGQRFEILLREKYPELLEGRFEGTPVVVALVNPDWSIAQSAKTSSDLPADKVHVDEGTFGVLGLAPDAVPYVGATTMQVGPGSPKLVLMVYTEKARPGERFVSRLFPDTRKQDRDLMGQQFPELKNGVPAGQQPWLLLDRAGVVLRRGVEVTTPEFQRTLEQRYGGIGTREVTATVLTNDAGEPLVDAGGQEVRLLSVWLAPGSPAPQD
jgi:hypothetical protein